MIDWDTLELGVAFLVTGFVAGYFLGPGRWDWWRRRN